MEMHFLVAGEHSHSGWYTVRDFAAVVLFAGTRQRPARRGARAVQPCDFPCIAWPERSLQLSCERGRASPMALFRTLMATLSRFREARESHPGSASVVIRGSHRS